MSRSVGDYRPRDAEHAVLYRVIDEHLDAFLETTRRQADGVPLPAFVEQEFYDFLTCGILAHGFARLRCTECTLERLVPFSCKGRGFCPSCGGRRMTGNAARLVDGVLPRVPVRPMGDEPAVLASVLARVGSRAGAGARRVRARAAGLPAAPRAPLWHPRRAIGLGAVRGSGDSPREKLIAG
jgi:Transposase zinc-binding domain